MDIFAINHPGLITVCESLPGISDHDIVDVQAVMSIKYQKYSQRKIYLWKKVDFAEVKKDFRQFSSFVSDYSVDTDVEIL